MDWTVVVIVAIVVWGATQAYKARQGIITDEDGNERFAPKAGALPDPETQRELAELRERVKVLERITTEDHKPKALSAEIEKLRDQ